MLFNIMLFVFVYFVFATTARAYDAPKTNCQVSNSTCYNGPHLDSYGQILSCSVPGTIAITFDDGPWDFTPMILDVLDKYNMKATFFVIGKNIYRSNGKQILQRIFKANHQVAGHTHSHPHIPQLPSLEAVRKETTMCEEAILSVSGNLLPRYWRPPYGETTAEANALVMSMGYERPISWTFSNQDTSKPFLGNTSHALNIYKQHLGGDNSTNVDFAKISINTLQHDRVKSTAESFEYVAKYLHDNFASKGVRFVTVAECLNDPKPYRILETKPSNKTVASPSTNNSTTYPPVVNSSATNRLHLMYVFAAYLIVFWL